MSTPHVPPEKSLPEITIKAILLGILLAVLLAGANAYLGLKAGMTVSASIPAAVISMAILRLFRRSNILENNIVQTAASAGESLAAGVIFTLPALVLLKAWTDFNYWQTTIIAGLGGMLGVLFTIPLRRALVVDSPLTFPEGVATAEVLKVGDEGGGIRSIAVGGIIGALFKLGESGFRLWAGVVEGGRQVAGSIAYFGTNASPALVAVGYIVGINIAVLVFLGGAINWYGAIPLVASNMEWPAYEIVDPNGPEPAWNVFALELQPTPEGLSDEERQAIADANVATLAQVGEPVEADAWANRIWDERTRYIGVGAMVLGGLWALIRLWGSLVRGISAGMRAYRATVTGENGGLARTERDTPMNWVGLALVVSVVPLFFVFHAITGAVGTSVFMAFVMLVAGFLFSAVASYMAGLVGSSNNPISGVTIATLLTSALLLVALGTDSASGPAAAILICAVVCCAAAIGGDNMQDLKAGHLLGATPYKQQIMQAVGVLSAALVMAPILSALLNAYGIGEIHVEGQEPLEAPQASLMKSVAEGVFRGGLPWLMVGIGVGVAALVIAIDVVLERADSAFRMPVLAVAVGIYLPLELSVPILFGGLIALTVKRFHDRGGAERAGGELGETLRANRARGERNGLLLAAGLITGEAMLGILLAIPLALWEGENRIASWFGGLTGLESPWPWPGLVLLVGVIAVLYHAATWGAMKRE
jgi:uncharacterized oligopeptide transporter (OPT) family protein